MRILLWIAVLSIFMASLAFAGVAGVYAYYARELPDYTQLDNRKVFQTARILDRNGELLGEFNDPQGGNRTIVPLDQIPRSLQDATIAAEDAAFYRHPGFDPIAIVRALWQNVRGGGVVSGASTITQQLVKNTLLSPEQTPDRKIKEALLAIEVTRRYPKERILELYLNEVYYGNLAYGVEAAAQTYFGKPVRDLDLGEATFIAGLPQAPNGYDPYTKPAAARERQQYVVEQMERQGLVDQTQAVAALSRPIVLRPPERRGAVEGPHFEVFIRELLEKSYSPDRLYREGLQIRTTLDLHLQRLAERTARAHIEEIRGRDASNAALVAIQPETGEILAMVGSVDFEDDAIAGQVNVALRGRQPGSTLKPFTYLTAFEKEGWSPATLVMDVPTTFGGTYTPLNYDAKFRGPINVRRALASSLNIPAVRALEVVGLDAMIATAQRMGISSLRDPHRYGLSVTLGGGEVTLLDLTYAYAPFANNGHQAGVAQAAQTADTTARAFDPVAILEIKDGAGQVLYQHTSLSAREIVDPGLAYLITHILSDDEARAETFGRNSPLKLSRPSAAKTGTTDDYRDSWVIGYTPDLVTGVWVGNSDGRPMRDVGGASGAGKIWQAFMEEALDGTEPRAFPRPDDVVEHEVCKLSGLLATPDCRDRVKEVFAAENVPTKRDDMHRRVEVCKVNGKLAFEAVPANARESKVFVTFPAPYTEWGPRNGYPPPPAQRCNDVYRGVRAAEIERPSSEAALHGSVQVIGSARLDDFHHFDLEVGAGVSPSQWSKITAGRTEGVDHGPLGTWDTTGYAAGRYTLRLTVYDRFGNKTQKSSSALVAGTAPPPSPTAAPTASAAPTAAPTADPTPMPRVAATPNGRGPAPPPPTPVRTAAPTAVPRAPATPTAAPRAPAAATRTPRAPAATPVLAPRPTAVPTARPPATSATGLPPLPTLIGR